tara:strand:+ start:899 stop:1306 length:408 start_codon:yes stop_codon:yes gene_type:complete
MQFFSSSNNALRNEKLVQDGLSPTGGFLPVSNVFEEIRFALFLHERLREIKDQLDVSITVNIPNDKIKKIIYSCSPENSHTNLWDIREKCVRYVINAVLEDIKRERGIYLGIYKLIKEENYEENDWILVICPSIY